MQDGASCGVHRRQRRGHGASRAISANLTQIKGGGLDSYWTETEVFRCEGGNAQLAEKLQHTLLESHVTLGAAVAKISAGGATASVTLADGTRVGR